MKLNVQTLAPGKRATLERIQKWMSNIATDLDAKKTHLDEMTLALKAAESSKDNSEKDAALNPDAALALAGTEVQITRLAPQVKHLQTSLEKDTATAIHQVNLARSTEVREVISGPLIEQLLAKITAALSPFLSDGWDRQGALQIMERTNQYRAISFFINRPPIAVADFDDAKREISAFVGEINRILAGGTVLEV
jgi:hypothetical protein